MGDLVRKATHEDVPRLVQLGVAMHAESRYSAFQINTEKGAQFFHAMIDDPNAIVLVDGEPLCAMFVGYVQPFWWGDELESFDIILYVLPERRGGAYAARLVTTYAKEAQKRGVSDMKIGQTTGLDSERTGLFFQRMGFAPIGSSFARGAVRTVH